MGRKKRRNRRSGGGGGGGKEDHENVYDEVDDFMNNRDRVLFNDDGDDDEMEDEMEEREELLLDTSDDDDDDDTTDDDDEGEARALIEEDEDEKYAKEHARRTREVENIDKQWGKRKKEYYSADTQDFDLHMEEDMEIAEQEEEEARRLQKERARALDSGDFGVDDLSDNSDLDDDKGATMNDEDIDFGDGDVQLQLDIGNLSDGHVEKVTRDLSRLSSSERVQMMLKDSPEMFSLIEELRQTIADVRSNVKPLLDRVRDAQLPTSDGVSFLELKFHLLLNYCINIAFYLLLKAEGVSVKDHPVIEQLVELRVVMEKMKPIDQKMKYQIDKLLRVQRESKSTSNRAKDPLDFRPKPSLLVDDDNGNVADRNAQDTSEKYVPPKLVSAPFVDKAAQKRERDRERSVRKLASSSYVAQLTAQMSDAPAELREDDLTAYGQSSDQRVVNERARFEEENFMRMVESKKDRKMRERASKIADNPWDDLSDLSGLAKHFDNGDEQDEIRRLREDMKNRALKRGRKKRMADEMDDDELRQAEELYSTVAASAKRSKEDKLAAYPHRASMYSEVNPDRVSRRDGGRRKASKQILKNRGLSRHQKPGISNPRVRRRQMYEKALIKRRRGVQEFTESQHQSYGGQKTGLTATTVRSTKLS